MSKVNQKIIVRSTDRTKFMDRVVELSAMGAKRTYGTTPRMVVPFTLEMTIEVDRKDILKSDPTTIAFPPDHDTFTLKQLEVMVWDEFREAVGQVGVKGRDRQKMTEDYLNVLKTGA